MFMNDFTAWCQRLICAEAPAFFPTVAFVSSVEGQICLGFIMKSFDLPDILWGALEPLHCENHWSKRWVFKAKRTIFSGLLDALLSPSFHPVPSLFRAGALSWGCVHPSPWAASGPHIPWWGSGQQAQTHPWWCCLSPAALNHHIHAVKTASIGTLGRSRPPMPVVVPSAPEVQETTRMLEDSESVSSRAGPECGAGSLIPPAGARLLPEPGLCCRLGLRGLACHTGLPFNSGLSLWSSCLGLNHPHVLLPPAPVRDLSWAGCCRGSCMSDCSQNKIGRVSPWSSTPAFQ